jgi:hypothetical protein
MGPRYALARTLATALWLSGLAGCSASDKTLEEQLIETNVEVSRKIDEIAERADLYVANDKYVDVPNKSRLVLYNGFEFAEGGVFRYRPRIGVKLHLPNVQEKLQLRFTSYDEDEVDRGINESRQRPASKEKTYGTSLALFQDLGKVKTEFRPRVEYLEHEIQTSYLFRFFSEAKRGSFSIEPEAQLFARSDTGTGQFVGINFGFQLTSSNHLTLLNEEQYTDGDNTFSTNHGFRFDHAYNDAMMQRTTLIVESDNRETYHLRQTTLSTSFRHKLRKEVLHYGITPYLTFPKDKAFHPVASLDTSLELIF